jgi:gliding motility-associated-like protein
MKKSMFLNTTLLRSILLGLLSCLFLPVVGQTITNTASGVATKFGQWERISVTGRYKVVMIGASAIVANPELGADAPNNDAEGAVSYHQMNVGGSVVNASASTVDFSVIGEGCAKVRHAYLYWGGSRGDDNTEYWTRPVYVRGPGQSTWQEVRADAYGTTAGTKTDDRKPYYAVADVSSQLEGEWSGQYIVKDVTANINASGEEGGPTAAWTLILLFEADEYPMTNFYLFDGMLWFSELKGPNGQAFELGTTVASYSQGDIAAYFGIAAMDGDAHKKKLEQATFNAGLNDFNLNELRSTTDYFAGTMTYNAVQVPRTPSSWNTIGWDAHHVDLPTNYVHYGSGGTTRDVNVGIKVTSGGGDYSETSLYPFMMYLGVVQDEPKVLLVKQSSVPSVVTGQTYQYALIAQNVAGAETMNNNTIVDEIDYNVDWIGNVKVYLTDDNAANPQPVLQAVNPTVAVNGREVTISGLPKIPGYHTMTVTYQLKVKEADRSDLWRMECMREVWNKATFEYGVPLLPQGDPKKYRLAYSGEVACGDGDFTKVPVAINYDPYTFADAFERNVTDEEIGENLTAYLKNKALKDYFNGGQVDDTGSEFTFYEANCSTPIANNATLQLNLGQSKTYCAKRNIVTIAEKAPCDEQYTITLVRKECKLQVTPATTPTLCVGSASGTATVSVTDDNTINNNKWTYVLSTVADADAVTEANTIDLSLPTTSTSYSFSGLAAGTYYVHVTNALNCKAVATIEIADATPMSVSLVSNATACVDKGMPIDFTASASGGPVNTEYSYKWFRSNDGATFYEVAAEDIYDPTYQTTGTMVDKVFMKVEAYSVLAACDDVECKAESTPVEVEMCNKIQFNDLEYQICSGTAFEAEPTLTSGATLSANTTYTWTVASVAGITGASNATTAQTEISQTLTSTLTTATAIVYTVVGTVDGVESEPFTITVTVDPTPVVTIGGLPTGNVCPGSTWETPLTSEISVGSTPALEYLWTGATAVATDNSTANYTASNTACTAADQVSLQIKDANGCLSELATATINVADEVAPSLKAGETITQETISGITEPINTCFIDVNTVPAEVPAFNDVKATIASKYEDACVSPTSAALTVTLTGTEIEKKDSKACTFNVIYTYSVEDACGNELSDQKLTYNCKNTTKPTYTTYSQTGVNACMPTSSTDAINTYWTLAFQSSILGNVTTACFKTSSLGTPTATISGDNCNWTVTFTFDITDECGNVLTGATATISGGDATKPTISGTAADKPMVFAGNCVFQVPDVVEDVRSLATDDCTENSTLTITQVPAAGTAIADPAAPGSITVTVEDACGNTETTTVAIEAYTKPTLTLTKTTFTICEPGTLDITTAATAPAGHTLSYWKDGVAVADATKISAAGTYTIRLTDDATGCYDEEDVTVTINPRPTVTVTDPDAVCFGETVDLNTAITSEKAGLTFQFFNGATEVTGAGITAAGAGTYTVVATNTTTTCSSVPSAPFTVTVYEKVEVTIAQIDALCEGSELDITAKVSGADTYAYYSDAAGTTALPNTKITAVGTTNFWVKGTKNGCPSDLVAGSVTINPEVTLTHTSGSIAQDLCYGSTIETIVYGTKNATNATVTGLPTGVSYVFDQVAQTITISGTLPEQANDESLTYTVSVEGAIAPCTNPASLTGTITIKGKPSIVYSQLPETCGQPIDVTASMALDPSSVGATIKFFSDANASTPLANTTFSSPGTYTYFAQAESALGCKSDIVGGSVEIKEVPVAPTVKSISQCPAQISTPTTWASLVSGTTGTLNWYDAGASISEPAAFDLNVLMSKKTYQVSQTVNGCESGKVDVSVEITNNLTAPNVSDYIKCAVVSGNAKPWSELVSTTGTQTWYTSEIDANNKTGSLTPADIDVTTKLDETSYWVTITDDYGCITPPAKVTAKITPRPTAVISGDATVCADNATTPLTVSFAGTAPFTFSYTDGSGSAPTAVTTSDNPHTFDVTPTQTRTYTLVSLSDAVNCPSDATADLSGSATVTVNASVTAITNAGADQTVALACKGDAVSTTLAATNPAATVNSAIGQWTFVSAVKVATATDLPAANESPVFADATAYNTEVSGLTAGYAYTLKWSVSNGTTNACTAEDEVVITIPIDEEVPTYDMIKDGAELTTMLLTSAGDCKFEVPNLIQYVTNKADNRTNPERLIVEQSLVATTPIDRETDVTITVTDECGNKTEKTVKLTLPDVPKINDIAVTDPNCYAADNSSSITVNVTGGVPKYEYSLDGTTFTEMPADFVITGLTEDKTLTIRDQNKCSVTENVDITLPTEIIGSATPTNVTQPGGADGKVTVSSISGGDVKGDGYEYKLVGISDPTVVRDWQASVEFANLSAGDYKIFARRTNSGTTYCETEIVTTVTVDVPGAIIGTVTSVQQTCFEVNATDNSKNASITASVSEGGTAPYKFQLEKKDGTIVEPYGTEVAVNTSVTWNNLEAGEYQVRVKDASDYSTLIGTSQTLVKPKEMTFDVVMTAVKCYGDNGKLTVSNLANNQGNVSYQWTAVDGGTLSSGETTAELTATAGKYTVTITDEKGCMIISDEEEITQPENPLAITTTQNDVIKCNGGTTTISVAATGGTSPYSYAWTGGTIISGATEATATVKAGEYTVTVTDANGCPASQSITVDEPEAVTFTTTAQNPQCKGEQGTITFTTIAGGSGVYEYNIGVGWISVTQGSSVSVDDGTYTVEVRDNNQCLASSSASHTLKYTDTEAPKFTTCPVSKLDLPAPATGCEYTIDGTQFDAVATDNCTLVSLTHNLEGAPSKTTLQGAIIDGYKEITWTAVDNAGLTSTCTFELGVKDVTPPVIPAQFEREYNWVMAHNTQNCTFEVPDYREMLREIYKNLADYKGHEGCTSADDLDITQTPGPGTLWGGTLTEQTQEVEIVVKDKAGNETPFKVTIKIAAVPDAPVITAIDPICLDSDPVELIVNTPTNEQEKWIGTGKFVGDFVKYDANSKPVFDPKEAGKAGDFKIKYDFSPCGCKKASELTIRVNDLPTVKVAVDKPTICSGTEAKFTASPATTTASPYTYSWTINGSSQTETGATFTEKQATSNVTASVMVTDGNGCTSKDAATATVTVQQAPAAPVATDFASCVKQGTQGWEELLIYTGGKLKWYADANKSTEATPTVVSLLTPSEQTYYASVVSPIGCESVEATPVTIEVNANPTIKQLEVQTIDNQQLVLLAAEGGLAPYTYRIGTEVEDVFDSSTEIRRLAIGKHKIFVLDDNGCSTEGIIEILPTPIVPAKFFTPNDDGVNDRWTVAGLESYPETELFIYDRYGKELASFVAADFEGWDGKYLGKDMPSTDYWYIIQVRETGARLVGHFLLKR